MNKLFMSGVDSFRFKLVILILCVSSKMVYAQDVSKPNVIIVLADDQGYGDFSCQGNPILKTPALDAFFKESISFSDFHVTPLCTPTRGELLTGVDAMRNGAATVLTARNIVRRDIPLMSEIFKEAGYTTGIFGKWHLGDTYPDRPMDRGFDKSIWHKGWGLQSEIEFDNDYYETRYIDSLNVKQSTKYCSNLWFDEAMDWMGEMNDKDKPFLTYIALNAPHGPFHSTMQDYKKYEDQVEDESVASFLGMITNIDRNFKRLNAWLDTNNLTRNTIVIYMNDNGTANGETVFNAGMRGKKGSNYEGGHKAVCFMRWPNGDIGEARAIEYPSQVQDILPTLIDLTGIKKNEKNDFDGISLLPLLKDGAIDERMFVIQYGGHEAPEKYSSCVVWDKWRLVGKEELYYLKEDPGQLKNVFVENKKIASKMIAHYDKWWSELEGDLNDFVPIVVGTDEENPMIFHSANWEDGAVNTQWAVAQGRGKPRGGVTHIEIAGEGTYKIYLSRWPFHLGLKLWDIGPGSAVGGSTIQSGKKLNIQSGCISINDGEPIYGEVSEDQEKIVLESNFKKGEYEFRAWFQDQKKQDLVGAYYVQMERIN